MLLLFRSSHLHPKNIRASWFESAMIFFQFLILSDHSSNCTAWSALISGMKAVLLKVKPWNLFERPLNWTYQTYQGSPSTERIDVRFLSFSPNSKFNVR